MAYTITNVLYRYYLDTRITNSLIILSILYLYQQFWYLHCFTSCLVLSYLINTQ
jgi:hypothetical protein